MTDYEAERRDFLLEVPEYYNFATDVVDRWAEDPGKLAILWVGQNNEVEQITFAQIARRSSQAANAFASAGITRGERVLLMLGSGSGPLQNRSYSYSLHDAADTQRFTSALRNSRAGRLCDG
jgi:acyl-CoA synthetase (AMP-forming)/AMP-acid ligase II